jgi:hypothetical protein
MVEDSPMYVNGQQVTATLDGLPISWGTLSSLIDHGSAVLTPRFSHYSVRSREGTFERKFGSNFKRAAGEALENGVPVIRNWVYNDWSPNFALIGAAKQTVGIKAKLNEKDQKQYDKKRDEVRKRLDNNKISKKCLDLLTKAGLTIESVLDAVNMQNAYDGEKSTISMSNAGYYKKGSLDGIEEDRRNGILNQQVAKFIPKNAKAATMIYPGGSETSSVAARSDVYFQIDRGLFGYGENSGLTQTTILHEALHSLTGFGDDELYKKLAGKTSDTSSADISKLLKDNDCTK